MGSLKRGETIKMVKPGEYEEIEKKINQTKNGKLILGILKEKGSQLVAMVGIDTLIYSFGDIFVYLYVSEGKVCLSFKENEFCPGQDNICTARIPLIKKEDSKIEILKDHDFENHFLFPDINQFTTEISSSLKMPLFSIF